VFFETTFSEYRQLRAVCDHLLVFGAYLPPAGVTVAEWQGGWIEIDTDERTWR